jgi:two-component system nitrate/nitrite response regulator NarL
VSRPVRVLIIDDHALVREGIRQALSTADFEVVGEGEGATDGLERAKALEPDVVVLDVSLAAGGNGLKVAERLRREVPATRILMLSVYDNPEYVLESVRVGAHGYLRKDTLPADLREAILTVADGRTRFERVLPGTNEPPPRRASSADRLAALTRRERDVLIGVASGKTNREIATELALSTRTVESYREALMRKLDIPTVAGLTKFALDSGLL